MTIAIMQPYFFPYIGYWQLINAVDTYVIYDDVNYIKKGYVNRNNILENDTCKLFTLELQQASPNKLINEIKIGNNKQKLLKTIRQNYIKAPYFREIYALLESIMEHNESNLAKFLGNSIEQISKYLEIDTKIIYSSSIEKDKQLRGQNKIINISKQLNASHYINAIGGKELYSFEEFEKEGIQLNFLRTKPTNYKQFNSVFVENLSIIDVLMFNNKKTINYFLQEYTLI